MDPAETRTLVALAEPHFQGFSEAAESVLDALQESLPGAVVLCQRDQDAEHFRVIDTRGPGSERLQRGVVLPLLAEDPHEGAAAAFPSLAEVRLDPEYLRAMSLEPGPAIPLELSDGQIVGVLCALAEGDDVYGPDHAGLLAIGARLLGHEWERVQSRAELSRLQNRLRDEGRSDPDTGLPNRTSFEALLEREWRLVQRGTVRSVLIACRVEARGLVGAGAEMSNGNGNGNGAGNGAGRAIARLALKDAAAALAANARTTDYVGRVSETSLAAVLVGCETTENAQRFIQRFESALVRTTQARQFRVDVSLGVELLADAGSSQEALQRAEAAAGDSVDDAPAGPEAAEHGARE